MTARMVRETTTGTFCPATMMATLIRLINNDCVGYHGNLEQCKYGNDNPGYPGYGGDTKASAGARPATPTEIFLPANVLSLP